MPGAWAFRGQHREDEKAKEREDLSPSRLDERGAQHQHRFFPESRWRQLDKAIDRDSGAIA